MLGVMANHLVLVSSVIETYSVLENKCNSLYWIHGCSEAYKIKL